MCYELSNGFKYTVITAKTNTISISLTIRAGSMHEKKNGTAHLLEHLIFKDDEIKVITQKLDCLGIEYNAITGRDIVTYKVLTTNDYLKDALCFFAAIVNGFRIKQNDLVIEKKIIENEIKRYEKKVPNILFSDILSKAYSGSFARPILGTAESLNEITIADIDSFYAFFYRPSNMALCICGNINKDKINTEIEKIFGQYSSDKINFSTKYISEIINRNIVVNNESAQSNICIAYKTPGLCDKFYVENMLLRTVLFDGIDSILYRKLRGEKGYIYILNGYLDNYKDKDLSHLLIYTATNIDYLRIVMDIISDTLEFIIQNGISDYEIIKASNKLKMEIYKNKDIHYRYSSCVSSNIINGLDDESNIINQIDNFSNENIKELLKQYYTNNNRIIYIS